ncbi:MarR family transcriptional regulator [Stackebrandtia soli]|uniref:MarR family transcriptional regulator n=1 Tax=Stackebrandtia soli TaxID=1892856 RepID=UPI0039E8566D
MTATSPLTLTGTRLRDLFERLDGAVAEYYAELGLAGFKPRYTPVARVLRELGPSPIRAIADALDVTHSAISQTVARMADDGLVTLEPGADGRQRVVHATDRLRGFHTVMDAEWAATVAAMGELEAELSHPLTALLMEVERALDRRPFADRIRDAAAR